MSVFNGNYSGGHLGDKISALLDGQMSAAATAKAWEHVECCAFCHEAVDREEWIKRRLAGLTYDPAAASDGLKGSLLGAGSCEPGAFWRVPAQRRKATVAAIGGGAIGAAVMGVLALGAAPASAPTTPQPISFANIATVSATPINTGR